MRLCSVEHNRKNWLFSDRPVGADTSAVIYSMVETAKLNGVNPYYYLYYVLENVSPVPDPKKLTAPELEKLMPWNNDLKEAVRAYSKKKED